MVQDTEKMMFRNAFQGYNKEDVNEYIKKQSKDFIKLEDEYKSTIEKKDSEIKKLTEKLDTQDTKKQKNPSTASLEAQIAKLNFTIESQKKEIKELKEEQKKSANLENLSDDELSKKIGDVLLVANRSADTMKAAAKAEADKLTSDTIKEADLLIADAKSKAAALKAAAEQDVRNKLDNIRLNIDTLAKNLTSEYEKGVAVLKNTVEKSITENSKQLEKSVLELKDIKIPTEEQNKNTDKKQK